MALAKRKVVSALLRKGFIQKKKGHHIGFSYQMSDGKLSRVRTRVSHGKRPKDLGDHLIHEMAKQVKLSTEDFERLVSCSMDQSEYEEAIKENL